MEQRMKENGLGMRILRLWLWIMPLAMLTLAITFAYVAADDGKWGLFAVMIVFALFAAGLLLLHWRLLRRTVTPNHSP